MFAPTGRGRFPLPEKLNFAEPGRCCAAGSPSSHPLAMYANPTDRVGIIGIGGLGHMAVKFAAAYGCDVTAFTSSESKFDEARRVRRASRRLQQRLRRHQETRRQLRPADQHRERAAGLGALIDTLAPNGRLHVVGAVLEPIPVSAFLAPDRAAQRFGLADRVAGDIATMLDFAARHDIAPQTEHFR